MARLPYSDTAALQRLMALRLDVTIQSANGARGRQGQGALDSILRDLDQRIAKQVPYAMSLALNDLAKEARTAAVKGLDDAFTIRNKFLQQGINYVLATKRKLQSAVGIREKQARILGPQIEGGARETGEDTAAVPTKAIRKKPSQKTGPSKWPTKILAGGNGPKRVFIAELSNGKTAVVRRLKKRGPSAGVYTVGPRAGQARPGPEKLETLYVFDDSIKIDAAYDFPGIVDGVVSRRWAETMMARLDGVLRKEGLPTLGRRR